MFVENYYWKPPFDLPMQLKCDFFRYLECNLTCSFPPVYRLCYAHAHVQYVLYVYLQVWTKFVSFRGLVTDLQSSLKVLRNEFRDTMISEIELVPVSVL